MEKSKGETEARNEEKVAKRRTQKRDSQEMQDKQERPGLVARGEHMPISSPTKKTANNEYNLAAEEEQQCAMDSAPYEGGFRDYLLSPNDGGKRRKTMGRSAPSRKTGEESNDQDEEDEERQMHEGNTVLKK